MNHMKVEDTLLRKITEIAGKREIGTVRVWGGRPGEELVALGTWQRWGGYGEGMGKP
jgi:hypothetical protein